jgi:hypothetical protein
VHRRAREQQQQRAQMQKRNSAVVKQEKEALAFKRQIQGTVVGDLHDVFSDVDITELSDDRSHLAETLAVAIRKFVDRAEKLAVALDKLSAAEREVGHIRTILFDPEFDPEPVCDPELE